MKRLLSPDEQAFVAEAALFLERPSFLVRVADLAGMPAALGLSALPPPARRMIRRAARAAIRRCLGAAIGSLPAPGPAGDTFRAAREASPAVRRTHVLTAGLAGGAGGFFGWPGLAVELPITTSLMMRSIAATAHCYGEDLDDPAVRLECLTVFSHGRPVAGDDDLDSAYLTTRAALADAVRRAGTFVATHGAAAVGEALSKGSAPVLVRLVAAVAARFEIVVTEKLVAQGLPLAGAVGGALINAVFTDHFARVAHHHFGLRHLERRRGRELVHAAYRERLGGDEPVARPAAGRRRRTDTLAR